MDYFNPNVAWMRHNDYQDTNMTEQKQVNRGCMQAVVYFIAFIIGILICSLFSSCTTTQYIPVIEHHTDTLIQTKVQHDSIYINDSTVITEKGDTVLVEKWHTKYVEKQVHDTLYIAKNDTVPQPYPVEVVKEVEKDLSTWQSFRMTLGTIALCMLAVYVVYRIIRKKLFPPAL